MSCVIEQIKTGLSYSFFNCTKAQQHRIFQIISIGGTQLSSQVLARLSSAEYSHWHLSSVPN